MQTSSDGVQSEIVGATDASYTLSFDDVGFLVSVSCEPVRSDLTRGPIVLSEHIGPVLPGTLACCNFYAWTYHQLLSGTMLYFMN